MRVDLKAVSKAVSTVGQKAVSRADPRVSNWVAYSVERKAGEKVDNLVLQMAARSDNW